MVAENAFLDAITAVVQGHEGLEAVAVGVAEPAGAEETPVVVLSLDEVHRARDGMGAHVPPGPGRVRLSGVLRLEVWGVGAPEVGALSDVVVEALLAPAALVAPEPVQEVQRLVSLDLTRLGSVEAPASGTTARRRVALFRFNFEHAVAATEAGVGKIKSIVVVGAEKEPFVITKQLKEDE